MVFKQDKKIIPRFNCRMIEGHWRVFKQQRNTIPLIFFKDHSEIWVESKLSGVKAKGPVRRLTRDRVAETRVIAIEVIE